MLSSVAGSRKIALFFVAVLLSTGRDGVISAPTEVGMTVTPPWPAVVGHQPEVMASPSANATSVALEPHSSRRTSSTVFLVVLWVLIAAMAKLVLRSNPRLGAVLPESCILISLGLAAGLLVRQFCPSLTPTFGAEDFFLFMLPPVLLKSGYCVPDRLIYSNLTTVLMLAVAGTGLFSLTLGTTLWLLGPFGVNIRFGEALLFAALLSSTDATIVLAALENAGGDGRHDTLRALLFGESLINNVVALVMYNTYCTFYTTSDRESWGFLFTDHFVGPAAFCLSVAGGLLIGVAWAFFVWFLTKFTADHHEMAPMIILIGAYLAYLNSRMFDLSGSLALTSYAIGCKTYVAGNLCLDSVEIVARSIRVLSGLAESVVFLFIGLSVVCYNHVWNTWFVVCTLVFCTIYRASAVRAMILVINIFRSTKISSKEALVIGCSGLRGSVAFALATGISEQFVAHKSLFSTTALVLVYFSVYVQGATIKPLLHHLQADSPTSNNDEMENKKNSELQKVINNYVSEETSEINSSETLSLMDDYAKMEMLLDKVVSAVITQKNVLNC